MKKILITTDFSTHSKNTINFVLNLMRDTQNPCTIILLNTYLVQHKDPSRVIDLNDELRTHSRTQLEHERKEAESLNKNPLIKIEIASHMGSLNHVIQNLLGKDQFVMVAMGKDGGKNVETVSTLLKQKQCPLLITYT